MVNGKSVHPLHGTENVTAPKVDEWLAELYSEVLVLTQRVTKLEKEREDLTNKCQEKDTKIKNLEESISKLKHVEPAKKMFSSLFT